MIKRLLPIMKKEFRHLIRDPRSLAITFFMPVVLLFLYSYAVSFDVKNIPTAVFDQDRTPVSRDFIARFANSGYFNIEEYLTSAGQFGDRLDRGQTKVIINIPPRFGAKVQAGEKAELQVLVDGADPTWASSAIGYVNGIALEYSQGLIAPILIKRGIRGRLAQPIELVSRIWYNETLRSLNFYLPGLICIILMQMAAILTSLTIVSEKEQGTLEGLVVSPVRKNELMLGKVIPYVVIAFFDIMMITALGVFWFKVPLKGDFFLLIVSSFIFLVGAMAIGVMVSTIAKTSQEAMQVATFATMLPSLLLSGFIFPIENMPWLLQGISYLIPARYYLRILRDLFLKGVGISSFWPDLLGLAVLSFVFMFISVRLFKKRIE
ncbi:MAG: ABC transporter permease [Candidatus Margulisiibacteriota bacterium]|jgi:ABC-2 type transport system permease protein